MARKISIFKIIFMKNHVYHWKDLEKVYREQLNKKYRFLIGNSKIITQIRIVLLVFLKVNFLQALTIDLAISNEKSIFSFNCLSYSFLRAF